MKKQLFSVLVCGAAVLSAGTFVSCDNEYDELSSRVSVLEGYINEIKAKLENALTTGASITEATQNADGSWHFVLSNGTQIDIAASSGGSAGGGSSVTVTQGEGSFTITVDGTSYTIPTGATVNSLVYAPEYVDGKVILGNDIVFVKFLARPAISEAALGNASFDIAEAHEVMTRASSLFKVSGGASIDGEFIAVPIKGIACEAGKTYSAAVEMTMGGTVISSDYFTIEVSEDFSFEAEQIGGFTVKSEYRPTEIDADGFCSMTVVGSALLQDNVNFANFFDALPENAVFAVAPKLEQPGGPAQEKYDILASSLKADGSFAFSSRPGTSFNSNEERPGFLVHVTSNDVIKAKIYVQIEDELAGLEEAFQGGRTGNFEAEWGGRETALGIGAQEIDICKILTNYEEAFPIIHNGAETWFPMWPDYNVQTADEDVVIYNDSGKLKMSELAETYAKGCRGIYWFFRGFAIYVPEALATDGKYIADDGSEWSGAEGYGVDMWMGQYNEYINDPEAFYSGCAKYGFTMDEANGIFRTPADYTGYGLRIAFDGGYEYAYGVYPLHGNGADQCGMVFFNRRVAPAGATMPSRL